MRMSARTRILMLTAVFVLAACGGSGSSKNNASPLGNANTNSNSQSNSGGSSNRSSGDDACKLITQSDATTLFGMAAQKTDDASGGIGAESVCIWKADDTDNHGFLLQIRIYDDEAHYGEKIFPDAQHVDGLGDKAFIRKTAGLMGVDVQFVKGGKTYTVNYSISNVLAKVRKNASDQADQLLSLVKAGAART